VRAFASYIACATSSNAHTYRLLIVKDRFLLSLTKRCVRQQQRGEIMKRFLLLVNPSFCIALKATLFVVNATT
jgi:hypothetical protein